MLLAEKSGLVVSPSDVLKLGGFSNNKLMKQFKRYFVLAIWQEIYAEKSSNSE